jgi:hypothetical protein
MHCYLAHASGSPTSRSEIDEVCWVNKAQDRRCAPAVSQLLRYLGPSLDARQRCPASATVRPLRPLQRAETFAG